jgi:hypothetical protein
VGRTDEVGEGDSAAPGDILTISVAQDGGHCVVSVTTSLTGTVYYNWYRNGRFAGVTVRPERKFHVGAGEQIEVDCIATRWRGFAAARHAPQSYHGRRRLEWLRSADSDVDHYLVQYQKDAGGWSTFRTVKHKAGQWSYAASTPTLDDGSTYDFRVIPVDTSSLEGTALSLDSLLVVRHPDVTDYAVSWSSGTGQVTFSAA